jgi:hypothetical protein
MVIIMAISKTIGHFSDNAGSSVRRVYTEEGTLLGVIRKLEAGGYRVYRQLDGKQRDKRTLKEAFQTIRRAN